MRQENAVAERVRQRTRGLGKTILLQGTICALLGFVSVKANLLGALAPFGVAFAASLPGKHAAPAILGSAIGYVIFAPPSFLKYIAALVLLLGFGWEDLTGGLARVAKPLKRPLLTAAALGLPGLTITILTGGGVYHILLVLCETAMAAAAVFFFARTRTVLPLGVENYRQPDVMAVLVAACILTLSLLPIGGFGFSLGRLLAAAIILAAAIAAVETGGAVTGIALGLTCGVLGGEGFLMAGYALGGLLAGVFSVLGKVGAVVAFAMVNLFLMLAGGVENLPLRMGELLVAGAAVLVVPQQYLSAWTYRKNKNLLSQESKQDLLACRLDEMSLALRGVADTTRHVNELLSQNKNDPAQAFHTAAEQVCKSCDNNHFCWQQRYNDTSNVLNDALGVLRRRGYLRMEDFPEYFRTACIMPEKLAAAVQKNFNLYLQNQDAARKVSAAKGVLTDQFEGLALLIDGLGEELSELCLQDTAAEGKTRRYLESRKVSPSQVRCILNKDGLCRLSFKISTRQCARLPPATVALDLSSACQRDFELPYTKEFGDETVYTFTEKATYTVKWGVSQISGGQSRHCGDSYGYVDAKWGRLNFILSDGMGSGTSAAVDSAMTADLLSRLLEAGVSMEGAMRLVNCALLAKNGQEGLATLDMTSVDLYTGRVSFHKAGAAPTFLLRNGKGGYVESHSLPIGIVSGVGFERTSLTLGNGDWIVMVSDGVTATGNQWVVKTLEDNSFSDPKSLCETISREAHGRRTDGHADDISVLAISLHAN